MRNSGKVFLRQVLTIAAVALLAAPVLEAQWATNGNHINNTNSGNVGVGTASPVARLHVAGMPASIRFQHLSELKTSNAIKGTLNFTDSAGSEYAWFGDGSTGNNFITLFAGTTHGLSLFAGGINVLTATTAGNIGIGTASPTEKFVVNGNAHFTGNVTGGSIAASYQDVAEWVPATSELDAGTVVVLNREKNNEVMPSRESYDTAVAGVVSAQPGLILGREADGMEMIATTGRVRVRVDATSAPIKVGDLLVTSAIPGLAMRSEPVKVSGMSMHRPGTIIGKALEPLAEGQGEILVLLSLQ